MWSAWLVDLRLALQDFGQSPGTRQLHVLLRLFSPSIALSREAKLSMRLTLDQVSSLKTCECDRTKQRPCISCS